MTSYGRQTEKRWISSKPVSKKPPWRKINAVFRNAMKCRCCFDQNLGQKALIDVAQPRWIGPRYFANELKVMVVLLNPGAGNSPEKRKANEEFLKILYEYRDEKLGIQKVFNFQRKHIPEWGTPKGRLLRFYGSGFDLKLDEIAIVNIAWCAEARNKWTREMLAQCFRLHTSELIQAIQPHVAILSGSGTHYYAQEIINTLPNCEVLKTLHYAHRKGKSFEQNEFKRVKRKLNRLKRQ